MSTFNIYVASTRRADKTIVHKLLEYCTFVVRKSEEEDYRKAGITSIWAIEDSEINSFSKVHNYIIEHAPEDIVCVLDDDMAHFRYSLDHNVPINDIEVTTREIERLAQIQWDLGVGLLGTRITASPKNYNAEYHFSGMIGPIRIYNRKVLKARYEHIRFFSDTDFVLQELLYNRIILRPDYFASDAKLETNKGGMNIRRNRKIQLELADYMSEKWGKYFSYRKENNTSKILVKR